MTRLLQLFQKKMVMYLILFTVFAISILSPLGSILSSYDYLPKTDWRAHSGLVLQAKMAIDEGQVPIRVAPWEHQNLRYPEYQFYGVFPFTLAGYLYKILTYSHSVILQNPFNTLKMLLLLSLVLGGYFAYCFAKLFTESDVIALLAATAYLYSPYLSFNLNLGGDFTDAFAQGLLPIALYYGFKILLAKKINLITVVFSAIAWFMILTSHLITFAYSSLFFTLAIILFFLLRISTWKRCGIALCSLICGGLLAAWYFVPVLQLGSHLAASIGTTGANAGIGLRPTSIFNLLTLQSGMMQFSPSYPWFYAAVGWPFLFAFLSSIYYLFWPSHSSQTNYFKIQMIITILFALGLFMTWSWVNIWQYLPYFFSIGQFGHRFLAQLSWIGVILLALVMQQIFSEKIDARHLVIGIFLLSFAGASWIVKPADGIHVSDLLKQPNFLIGSHDYFIRPETLPPYPGFENYGFVQIPLLRVDSQLFLDRDIQLPAYLFSSGTTLILKGKTLTSAKPGKLQIYLNHTLFAENFILPNKVIDWKIPLQSFSDVKGITLSFVAKNQSSKTLPMDVKQLEIVFNQYPQLPLLSAEKTKSLCQQRGASTECQFNFMQTKAIQLPVFYYPELLSVTMDGQTIDYQASFYRNPAAMKKNDLLDPEHDIHPYMMTTIVVPSGQHLVAVKMNGVAWANQISLYSWIIVILFGFIAGIRYFCQRILRGTIST
jgi:hypothetical protein